jgi:hypothetical protein
MAQGLRNSSPKSFFSSQQGRMTAGCCTHSKTMNSHSNAPPHKKTRQQLLNMLLIAKLLLLLLPKDMRSANLFLGSQGGETLNTKHGPKGVNRHLSQDVATAASSGSSTTQ